MIEHIFTEFSSTLNGIILTILGLDTLRSIIAMLGIVKRETPFLGRLIYGKYDIIHFLRREMLDFTAFPVFFVSNLLLVQCKKYYFNRATVSRNCSIVL